MQGNLPIAALLEFKNEDQLKNIKLTVNDFKFHEWVYLKPRSKEIFKELSES